MYWLAGCRATIPHQFLVGAPYVLMTPILYPSPWWVYTVLVVFSYLTVDWMHLNVSCGSKWLEFIIVTPRYHHVHHSSNPDHYELNLGNNFTFWDRLFGTYLDPDSFNRKQIAFGIGENPNPVRLIAGVSGASFRGLHASLEHFFASIPTIRARSYKVWGRRTNA